MSSSAAAASWHDGPSSALSRELTAKCISIINRSDPDLVEFMQAQLSTINPSKGPTYELLDYFGAELVANCKEAVATGQAPLWKEVYAPTAPCTEIDAKGNIVYREAKREGVRKLEAYVKEMETGTRTAGTVAAQLNTERAHENITKLWSLIRNEPSVSKLGKATIKSLYTETIRSLGPAPQNKRFASTHRSRRPSDTSATTANAPGALVDAPVAEGRQSFLTIQRKVAGKWQPSAKLTRVYFSLLDEMAREGLTFENKNALVSALFPYPAMP